MPSPEVLDFEKLLAPIPGELPAGSDLRSDQSSVSVYHTIRSARKAASDTERDIEKADPKDQADPKKKIEPPDWRPVLEAGKKALAERSKDLEITAYLIEALVRLQGFAGLRDGFRLAREFILRFWDGLYPKAEDPDVENRFATVLWLSGIDRPGTLIVPVRRIPLTTATSDGTYRLTHYLQAQALAELSDAQVRQQRIDAGAVTLDIIRKAVAQTPAEFYGDLVDDLSQAYEEFTGFCAALCEKSGYDPPKSDLLNVLESWTDALKDVAAEKLPERPPVPSGAPGEWARQMGIVREPAVAPVAATDGSEAASSAAGATPTTTGAIRNRQDALDRLMAVAQYFRLNEPQSIIPFALEQVVHWGRLSLPDLLRELIDDETARTKVYGKVGINPEAAEK